jgi:hypothetical protein
MRRIVRPGPRPFIAGSVIFIPLVVAMLLLVGLGTGRWGDAAQCAGSLFAIGALFFAIVARNRLVVTDKSIGYRIGFSPIRHIYFRDITTSVPIMLAESDWPITLAIYGADTTWPALWVPLKPWRQSDVEWLLSLRDLKLEKAIRCLSKRGAARILKDRAQQQISRMYDQV